MSRSGLCGPRLSSLLVLIIRCHLWYLYEYGLNAALATGFYQ